MCRRGPGFHVRFAIDSKHVYFGDEAVACRTCSRLDYASCHLHRSVPGIHRVMRLRRKIGADVHPFAPLPRHPRAHQGASIAW